jgi:hypothetical protein
LKSFYHKLEVGESLTQRHNLSKNYDLEGGNYSVKLYWSLGLCGFIETDDGRIVPIPYMTHHSNIVEFSVKPSIVEIEMPLELLKDIISTLQELENPTENQVTLLNELTKQFENL